MIDKEKLEPYAHRADILIGEFKKIDKVQFPENYSNVEKCIVYLRMQGYPYKSIQMNLGMISKKLIRDILNDYDPELIKLDTNYHKIPDNLHKDYDWNWEEFKKKGENKRV